jgi:hypothetical protein
MLKCQHKKTSTKNHYEQEMHSHAPSGLPKTYNMSCNTIGTTFYMLKGQQMTATAETQYEQNMHFDAPSGLHTMCDKDCKSIGTR